MSPSAGVHVIEDDRYRQHEAPPGHPERPERLLAVHEAFAAREAQLIHLPTRRAEPSEILAVHGEPHLALVERAAAAGPGQLDADTYVSPASFEIALLAAGGAVELASAIATGRASCGIAAVRPPGHHAEAGRAMGFCLFNNIAIAARALQRDHGLARLLILDWDVHHGNGTQHSFEDDPSILYVSTHQFPYYPGTGDAGEIGHGRGTGTTVNVPLPAGCGDTEYVGVFQRIVEPVARAYAPDMILVSCGFDAHRDDPLASMRITKQGFLAMTHIVRNLADELCGGRLCFVLEGGYSATSLREGTGAVLTALLAARATPPPLIEAPPGSALRATLTRVVAAQRGRYRLVD